MHLSKKNFFLHFYLKNHNFCKPCVQPCILQSDQQLKCMGCNMSCMCMHVVLL